MAVDETENLVLVPKVTLIALSYNTGKYVIDAIQSALDQGYPNLEVICIDDGSIDDSPKLLSAFSQAHGFFFMQNETNLGISKTLNKGLQNSTGDYILVIGDDVLLPSRISKDVQILARVPQIDFVCSKAKIIDSDGNLLGSLGQFPERMKEGIFTEVAESVWLRGSRVFTPTVTYRAKALRDKGGWDEDFEVEDKPMFLSFARSSQSGWFRNEITTYYRRHQNNFSSKIRNRYFSEELLLVEKFRLQISNLKINFKFLMDAHYFYLFLGADPRVLATSLVEVNRIFLAKTLKSVAMKVILYMLFSIKRNRYVKAKPRHYFLSNLDKVSETK